DHDDVGVLAQNRAQTRRERQADVGIDLYLVDAGHFVFDRVFQRHDVDGVVLDLLDQGVEAGRFARAGRAGSQDHTVGLLQTLADAAQIAAMVTKIFRLHAGACFVEQTDDDLFAPDHRRYGDTQIDFLAAHLDG